MSSRGATDERGGHTEALQPRRLRRPVVHERLDGHGDVDGRSLTGHPGQGVITGGRGGRIEDALQCIDIALGQGSAFDITRERHIGGVPRVTSAIPVVSNIVSSIVVVVVVVVVVVGWGRGLRMPSGRLEGCDEARAEDRVEMAVDLDPAVEVGRHVQ